MAQSRRIAHSTALLLVSLAVLCCDVKSAAAVKSTGTWYLQTGRGIASSQRPRPTLSMDAHKLSGSTGCNSFTATVSDRPEKKVAIEQVTLTRKLCGPQEGKVEEAFVRALSETEFLKKERKTLTFLSGKKESLLVWKRADKATRSRSTRRKSPHASRRHTRAAHLSMWCGWR
jgi:heat shock protein HslJ